MTQQNSTVNLLIHDANGQPQMIKVVQSTPGKALSQLVKNSFSGTPVKTVFKTATSQESGQSILTAGSQVFTFKGDGSKLGSRIVHLQPVGQKIDSQTLQKIRVTTSQVPQTGGLKVINTAQQKVVQHHQIQQPQQQQQQTSSVSQGKNKTYLISPILDHTGARKRHDVDSEYSQPEYKRRKTEKLGKGLRHFSMKVCEKVRKKGTTSYNEVADELVAEFTNPSNINNSSAEQYDQKNIRRRVYDALNVLMAMNIISKEKKEIRWLGLPTNSLQECLQLEKEKQKKIDSIKQKTQQLRDLIYQQISFKNLVERNREQQRHFGVPPINSTIPLPFIIVNTDKKTSVECSISNDKMEYSFTFDDMFEINDDIEVLKRIGMLMGLDKGQISEENIRKAKSMLPKSLEKYVEQLAHGIEDPTIEDILSSAGPGPSCSKLEPLATEFVETQLVCEGDTSHQSSFSDPLSPNHSQDFSDDEQDSDEPSSDDIDIN